MWPENQSAITSVALCHKKMETHSLGGKISSTALKLQCYREYFLHYNFTDCVPPKANLWHACCREGRIYKHLRAMVDATQDVRHCAEGCAALGW